MRSSIPLAPADGACPFVPCLITLGHALRGGDIRSASALNLPHLLQRILYGFQRVFQLPFAARPFHAYLHCFLTPAPTGSPGSPGTQPGAGNERFAIILGTNWELGIGNGIASWELLGASREPPGNLIGKQNHCPSADRRALY